MIARYFGQLDKRRGETGGVFGDRQSGAYMRHFAWTTVVRHQTVLQGASPDDPALAEYWARRRRRTFLPINNTSLWLLKAQDGCCPICKTPLFADQPQTPIDWEAWLAATRTTITIVKPVTGTPDTADHRLIHTRCNGPALLPALPANRACLSRMLRETGTSGSEEGPAPRGAGLSATSQLSPKPRMNYRQLPPDYA